MWEVPLPESATRGYVLAYLGQPRSLDEVVEFAHSCLLGEALYVSEEVLGLSLEEPAVVSVLQGLRPEGADVDAQHLGRVDDLAQGPHEGPVDAHQLLRVHLVGLVQHHADLVVLAPEGLDGLRELVRDVQFVSIKEQDDPVDALSEPLQDLAEVVP